MREWFENESFWRELYPFMFGEQRFAVADKEVRKLLKLTGVRRGAVLDLCCGPGRHSIALAKRGFRLTGVDRTRFLLNKARRHAKTARVQVEFVQSDMRDFVRPDTYTLALSLFTSFGYFDNKNDDRLVLRNIFASLNPGGVVLIDVLGRERLARSFQRTTSDRLPNGDLSVQMHEAYDNWSRIRNEWILVRGNRARRFKFHHTVYSGQELKKLLLGAGFRQVKLFGDLDGHPYGPNALRLIAMARKR